MKEYFSCGSSQILVDTGQVLVKAFDVWENEKFKFHVNPSPFL